MPDLGSILERESRTVEPPDGFERLQRRRHRRRRNRRIGTAVLALAVATFGTWTAVLAFRGQDRPTLGGTPSTVPGFVCPPGSTPDRSGPVDQARPQGEAYLSMAFDRGSGRMVLLTGEGKVWAFDVCTNTWEPVPGSMGPSGPGVLVYDSDSDLTIAIDAGSAWAYDLDERTWTRKGQVPVEAMRPEAVHDPVTGLVVVRDPVTSLMWTYDVDSDTWAEVDQGENVPPTLGPIAPEETHWAHALLSYDASTDRLVLYLGDNCHGIPQGDPACPLGQRTWEFDPRAHRWTEQDADTPDVGFAWVASGDELAYDEANEVSVLFSFGTAAAYDASAKEWQVLFRGVRRDPMSRMQFAMAYDPANERLVVFGGSDTDDVWAFDVATGEWIQLLAPRG